MKLYRAILMGIAIVLLVIYLGCFDYTNWAWSCNSGNYIGIIAMSSLILSLISSSSNEKQTEADSN